MSTVVLVHGGWAGSWVWEEVAPELADAGHDVLTPDLPGHGADRTPIPRITMESYVARVLEVLDAAAEPVVLVGHSSSGAVVSQAAEHRPDAIRRLVFLAAHLPEDGRSVLDLVAADGGSLLAANLTPSPDGTSARIRHEALRAALFADCAEKDYVRATARFRDEPLGPPATPAKLTADRFGRVPRAYVECLRDRALSLSAQRAMQALTPCSPVVAMDTGHMPMYAAPGELARHLSSLAQPVEG